MLANFKQLLNCSTVHGKSVQSLSRGQVTWHQLLSVSHCLALQTPLATADG